MKDRGGYPIKILHCKHQSIKTILQLFSQHPKYECMDHLINSWCQNCDKKNVIDWSITHKDFINQIAYQYNTMP